MKFEKDFQQKATVAAGILKNEKLNDSATKVKSQPKKAAAPLIMSFQLQR